MSHGNITKAPDGFENIIEKSQNGKHVTFLRCTKESFDPLTKKKVQCSYKIRKDHYKSKAHQCIFSNLDSFIRKKEHVIQQSTNSTEKYVFEFAGRKNIPIKSMVSDEFYDLLKYFFELGKNNGTKDFETLYPQISRKKFTDRFIIYSDFLKSKHLKNFKGYSCLVCDGGKVGSDSLLNIVIINPHLDDSNAILFDSIYGFDGTCDSYIKVLSRSVLELSSIGITITGIVNDNLKPQIMATDPREPRSLQRCSEDTLFKTIIRVPCQCHVVSLAMKDLTNTCFLENVEKNLSVVVREFRKRKFKKWICAVCPSLCPTRWTNLYDVFSFLLKHFDRICTIMMTANPVVKKEVDKIRENLEPVLFYSLKRLNPFLLLYQKLIHILESDNTLASDCVMIYIEFFDHVKHVCSRFSDEEFSYLGNLFTNQIKTRIHRTGNFPLLVFLSSFTINGRNVIRKELSNQEFFIDEHHEICLKQNYFILSNQEEERLNQYINVEHPNILKKFNEYLVCNHH